MLVAITVINGTFASIGSDAMNTTAAATLSKLMNGSAMRWPSGWSAGPLGAVGSSAELPMSIWAADYAKWPAIDHRSLGQAAWSLLLAAGRTRLMKPPE
jgi:hypothetical protein